jgi:hypothetical protein
MHHYEPYISKDFVIQGSFLRLDDKEKAWEEVEGRMRTEVRKAQKSDVVMRRSEGNPLDMKAFTAICLNPEDIPKKLTDRYHLFFAEFKDELVGGILLVEIGTKLFMLCHASTDNAKKIGVPSLLLWNAVEEFSGKKFSRLDVGTSYRPSLQKFFSGWSTQNYPMIMRPPELKPSLMLTPFDTEAMNVVLESKEATSTLSTHLKKKWQNRPYTFFPRGMYAIFALMKHLKDENIIRDKQTVAIITTTETHYVSSCVTSAIETMIPWKREVDETTGTIFVIHEFGFPHPKLSALRKIADEKNIPLIEDCAYAWHTEGVGAVGDYAIFSLTKAFPLQFGGYLVGKEFSHRELWDHYGCSDEGKQHYTERRLAQWIQSEQDDGEKRRENYKWYEDIFGKERTYFPLTESVTPGAFILKMKNEEVMKETSVFVGQFGIECGNYWKNSAIILPVHQRLEATHLEYIAGSVLSTEREWCGVPGKS